MDVDLDELIKRSNTPNLKNHGIRRLASTNVPFNGIPYILISIHKKVCNKVLFFKVVK